VKTDSAWIDFRAFYGTTPATASGVVAYAQAWVRSPDGKPVDLVFLLLGPAADGTHLRALAAVSRRLRTPGVAEALRGAAPASLRAALLEGAA